MALPVVHEYQSEARPQSLMCCMLRSCIRSCRIDAFFRLYLSKPNIKHLQMHSATGSKRLSPLMLTPESMVPVGLYEGDHTSNQQRYSMSQNHCGDMLEGPVSAGGQVSRYSTYTTSSNYDEFFEGIVLWPKGGLRGVQWISQHHAKNQRGSITLRKKMKQEESRNGHHSENHTKHSHPVHLSMVRLV